MLGKNIAVLMAALGMVNAGVVGVREQSADLGDQLFPTNVAGHQQQAETTVTSWTSDTIWVTASCTEATQAPTSVTVPTITDTVVVPSTTIVVTGDVGPSTDTVVLPSTTIVVTDDLGPSSATSVLGTQVEGPVSVTDPVTTSPVTDSAFATPTSGAAHVKTLTIPEVNISDSGPGGTGSGHPTNVVMTFSANQRLEQVIPHPSTITEIITVVYSEPGCTPSTSYSTKLIETWVEPCAVFDCSSTPTPTLAGRQVAAPIETIETLHSFPNTLFTQTRTHGHKSKTHHHTTTSTTTYRGHQTHEITSAAQQTPVDPISLTSHYTSTSSSHRMSSHRYWNHTHTVNTTTHHKTIHTASRVLTTIVLPLAHPTTHKWHTVTRPTRSHGPKVVSSTSTPKNGTFHTYHRRNVAETVFPNATPTVAAPYATVTIHEHTTDTFGPRPLDKCTVTQICMMSIAACIVLIVLGIYAQDNRRLRRDERERRKRFRARLSGDREHVFTRLPDAYTDENVAEALRICVNMKPTSPRASVSHVEDVDKK